MRMMIGFGQWIPFAGRLFSLPILILLILFSRQPQTLASVCAEVKIQIKQELTLERQAFDAHMRIHNGLSHITLENISIQVFFTDEEGRSVLAGSDPNNTQALFFIRLDSMDNIDGVDGSGTVAPSSSADLHWLIIPAPGASRGLEQGTLYYVGATLSYTIGGEEHATEVTPDYIFVKPMPELTLDYFLPEEVYGDDAFTAEIEPPVPFTLGVRVKNNGFGVARDLKIDSAQPKIVENVQGLLVGFVIEACAVHGNPAQKSLLARLGDIRPGASGTARWVMTSSLSGRFVDFGAVFSHSDELGGELTSLLQSANTHTLVRDVLVDVSGRDAIRDFLAKDGSTYRIYESDTGTLDAEVQDLSSSSSLNASGGTSILTVPPGAGFFHVYFNDPHNGRRALKEVIRSDGKRIKGENVWRSKKREGQGWNHLVNLFDVHGSGSYRFVFEEGSTGAHPPVLQFIPDRIATEGGEISFLVSATDEDGDIPSLSAAPLPLHASFTDSGDGIGHFRWFPSLGQAGQYPITFIASDGLLSHSRIVMLTVIPLDDPDGDGMPDSWEMAHFGTLERDGTGDFDKDGISDLDEFLNGTDPTVPNHGPYPPEIASPLVGSEVIELHPELIVRNSNDPDGDVLTYEFELYSDGGMGELVVSASHVPEGEGISSWFVPVELRDNTRYFWRARAYDGALFSLWTDGSFFVNTADDRPGAPHPSSPRDQSETDSLSPRLEITNSPDPDEDLLTYTFEVYGDEEMIFLVATASGIPEGADGTTSWVVDPPLSDGTRYFWRALAVDQHGAGAASTPAAFLVNTQNRAPSSPAIVSPEDGSEWIFSDVDLVAADAFDPEGGPILYYFEVDTVNTFDGTEKRASGEIVEGGETTSFSVTGLEENTRYFWRVKSSDGRAESPWVVGTFLVNAVNEPPAAVTVGNPGQGAWVSTMTPILAVHPAWDSDRDSLHYLFEIYSDPGLTSLLIQGSSLSTSWQVPFALEDSAWHYFRAWAADEHGAAGPQSPPVAFFVKDDGMDDPPTITLLEPAMDFVTNGDTVEIRWEDSDPDSNASISLYYDTDNAGEGGVLIVSGLGEDPDGEADSYLWDITGMPEGTYSVYGVITDGNGSAVSYSPGSVTIDRTPPVLTALPPGGHYATGQHVVLSANEAAEIFYTLDGTDPSIDSFVCTGVIEIEGTSTLRAIALDSAGNPSEPLYEVYTISSRLRVSVVTDKGRALPGVKIYAFTESGAYTGKTATSDLSGSAEFDSQAFSAGSYKFRVDYLGSRFWSGSIVLPGSGGVHVTIEEEAVQVTVTTGIGAVEGSKVYLFSQSGAYLGLSQVTNAAGQVSFVLPTGIAFRFRADILGGQYWSADINVAGGGLNSVDLAAGGGLFQITVEESPELPMEGIKVYLFSAGGSYLGLSRVTDASGLVGFPVPEGTFKVRAETLGYPFWSPETQVTTDTTVALTIPHENVPVFLNGVFQDTWEPLGGIRTYLFSESGAYLGRSLITDENGISIFRLPQKPFRVRADFLGRQYWTDPFTWEDQEMEIPLADAEITATGGGFPLAGQRVYVFSTAGSYLGMNQSTDPSGKAIFRLPEGSYKFRVDHLGNRYFSGEELLTAHILNPITVSTGGGTFMVTVLKEVGTPLSGVKCHVFNGASSYLGLFGSTDENGRVSFNLAEGTYLFRIDHLGYRFWSDPVTVPDALSSTVEIVHERVEARVETAYGFVEGVRVYLFSEGGAYLGLYKETDGSGKAEFELPVGRSFQFRADLLGSRYWSAITTVFSGEPNFVPIHAGGGTLQVALQESPEVPMEGTKVYLFNGTGSYLGLNGVTDALGLVEFDLPEGVYRARADYLGYPFWSEEVLVEGDTELEMTLPHETIEISVSGLFQDTAAVLSGVKVYLFSPTDSYLGLSRTTDTEGKACFRLPQRDYKARVDYLGEKYWSGLFNGANTSVSIPLADAEITMTGGGFPQSGQKVYAYSESGTYLGLDQTTDQEGKVVFRLPEGSYKFRVDHQGNRYWSEVESLVPHTVNPIIISTGGGSFTFTVEKAAGVTLIGGRCYVFNTAGVYLGMLGATDEQGRVYFDLASGTYRFRLDHLGYRFWSLEYNTSATLTGHMNLSQQDVTVTAEGLFQHAEPIEGAITYLFTPQGAYLGEKRVTDPAGKVVFNLPDRDYKVRVDYLGEQFWSEEFKSLNTTVTVNHGEVVIQVDRSGMAVEGAKVYLFSRSGSYLGRYEYSDSEGKARFLLPDRAYKFRIDQGGDQVWTPVIGIQAHMVNPLYMDLD